MPQNGWTHEEIWQSPRDRLFPGLALPASQAPTQPFLIREKQRRAGARSEPLGICQRDLNAVVGLLFRASSLSPSLWKVRWQGQVLSWWWQLTLSER